MNTTRKPEWLKKKIDFNEESRNTSILLNKMGLNTVCKEAKCPNISECFKNHHATFLILGKYCTRHCTFCNVEKNIPQAIDKTEPAKIAEAVQKMKLKHVVITSVTRDDLSDGGASAFIETVKAIHLRPSASSNLRSSVFKITIEFLISDFQGNLKAIENTVYSKPDIIGHNVETVSRLYRFRPEASYKRSLHVLKQIKKTDKNIYTKSAIMLGLGETKDEVLETMEDLRSVSCDLLAIGQYLRPSIKHTEVAEYISPEKFAEYKTHALSLGFKHVESSPYARSSYHAAEYIK